MSFPPFIFYELSAGLRVAKVNQVLGIIRKELKNETEKTPHHDVAIVLGAKRPKVHEDEVS